MNAGARNISVSVCNDGSPFSTGTIETCVDGDEVYLRVDWATRKVYIQVNSDTEVDTGITLGASAIGTNFAGTASLLFDSATPAFTPANLNFDLGDSTGGKTAMSYAVEASLPSSPAGKLYEVSGAGTVLSKTLAGS